MKVKKIISRIKRKFIFLYDGNNTKKYMDKYNKWLKKAGMDLKGKAKYICSSAHLDGVDYSKIHLGDNIVLSMDVIILVHDFSVEAGMCAIGQGNPEAEAHTIKDVYIGDNCFVGARVTILGGTVLGKNCIVGAGSVLPGKSYPDNSIIVGNPGRVIGNTIEWAKKKSEINAFERGYF